MKTSVEISMYPLRDDYVPPIESFIAALNRHANLRTVTNPMSTQVFGDYEVVMVAVATEIRRAFEDDLKAAFAIKVLPGDLSW